MRFAEGYPKYSVTEDGRVYTHRLRKGFKTPVIEKNGYHRVQMLHENGKLHSVYIHQIVARTYIPNPDGKRFVNHKDHDKSNNAVSNLAWCTHLENIQHDWKLGVRVAPPRGEKSWNAKYSDDTVNAIKTMRAETNLTLQQIANHFHMPWSTVQAICAGRIRK